MFVCDVTYNSATLHVVCLNLRKISNWWVFEFEFDRLHWSDKKWAQCKVAKLLLCLRERRAAPQHTDRDRSLHCACACHSGAGLLYLSANLNFARFQVPAQTLSYSPEEGAVLFVWNRSSSDVYVSVAPSINSTFYSLFSHKMPRKLHSNRNSTAIRLILTETITISIVLS